MEPLYAQLVDIEAATQDQLDLIAAVKANVLRNDERMQKMIGSITKS